MWWFILAFLLGALTVMLEHQRLEKMGRCPTCGRYYG